MGGLLRGKDLGENLPKATGRDHKAMKKPGEARGWLVDTYGAPKGVERINMNQPGPSS